MRMSAASESRASVLTPRVVAVLVTFSPAFSKRPLVFAKSSAT
jgi:hypothetical protein